MKKFLLLFLALFLVTIHAGNASAAIVKNEEKVSFTMTENQKTFMMYDESNPNRFPSQFGYRFTIYDAEGCTIHARMFRMSLSGNEIMLSEKNFTGNHYDFSATDQAEAMPYKNHYLELTKDQGCGEVKVKGLYGYQFDNVYEY
ncbi:hypothetical protein BSBH6_01546 [Bacillus subtilis]|uniref:YoaW n=1 Tax=Bacillus cabrialesii subsp. tritici TaxID=2944916 RepID=A0ABT9DKM2_9BACI|nr:hypothetical protein [Bacillus cabrialesii]AUZ26675.1 hypothetical protein C1T25_10620 [Bacillus cereus]POO76226.1 hypothetical protein C1T28_03390 [Bacillus subtilis]MBU2661318.1 hypothetical protein [Bacillus cabrialesii]MDO8225250.1 hypothetical protein [Bacillus cabrialesii subsp. tritici]RPK04845.1 hypothetical protein BSBH6_01546 [Bacillus subtilis]